MALTTNSFGKDSPKNFLINSAAIYTNVKYAAEGGFTGTKLGATNGGVTVKIENSYRKMEVDGTSVMDVKGLEVLESATATATAKLKEFTAEKIKQALNGTLRAATEAEAPAGAQIVESKLMVEDTDYIDNIGIVGRLSGNKEPIIFILDNVLATNGIEVETEDASEAVIEQEYKAHASFEQLEADQFPWRIIFPAATKTTAGTESVVAPANV
ncbi:MAG: hypothetical protein WCS15_10400 [Prevotella sp.]